MNENSLAARVAATRAELEDTLNAIEDKLNVPKRVAELAGKVRSCYAANPLPWIIGAAGVAVIAAGLITWAVLSNDD